MPSSATGRRSAGWQCCLDRQFCVASRAGEGLRHCELPHRRVGRSRRRCLRRGRSHIRQCDRSTAASGSALPVSIVVKAGTRSSRRRSRRRRSLGVACPSAWLYARLSAKIIGACSNYHWTSRIFNLRLGRLSALYKQHRQLHLVEQAWYRLLLQTRQIFDSLTRNQVYPTRGRERQLERL